MDMIYVKGQDIFEAAVAGANLGYNRSTDQHGAYSAALKECFDELLATSGNRKERRSVMRNTKNDWRNAYLPLCLALYHHHIAGKPTDVHARVYLGTNPGAVFDIPMPYWNKFFRTNPLRAV